MKRVSKFKLEKGKIYKLLNKRMNEIIIFKILTEDIQEMNEGVDIDRVHTYIRKVKEKYYESEDTDLKIFKDDILFELTKSQLFEELL